MEFPTYLLIIGVCAALVLWTVQQSRRKPGTKVTGLFAYRDDDDEAAAPEPRSGRGERSGRWTGRR
jgi:hypothetical protein